MDAAGYERYSYIDIPSLGRIVALVPMSDTKLFVLGTEKSVTIDGNFSTITALSTSLSVVVNDVTQSVGCITEQSVVKTPFGVLFASRGGVYSFDGSRMSNVMQGRIKKYWDSQSKAGMTVYGASFVDSDHYYLSTSAGGFLCNLNGFRWTLVSGLDMYMGAIDPSDLARVYAVKRDISGASTLDKVFRIDTILTPAAGLEADANGTNVAATIKTKADSGVVFSGRGRRIRAFEDPTMLKKVKHTEVGVNLTGGGAVTVTATPGLQAEESTQTLATFASNANPQVIRTSPSPQIITHAMGYTIAQTGAAATMDLLSIAADIQPLRGSRIT
jgi:hypothetical protein